MKETIEEVAERILANNIDGLRDALKDDDLFFFYKGVIQCYGESMAKWQQERMYSEEEVRELLLTQRGNSYVAILTKTRDTELASLAMSAPEPSGKNGWFKQFKNK